MHISNTSVEQISENDPGDNSSNGNKAVQIFIHGNNSRNNQHRDLNLRKS